MWPTMALPNVLLVQLLQVRLRLAGNARPSSVEPVMASCWLGCMPTPVKKRALLGERRLARELVTGAVKIGDAGGDDLALEVPPRAASDAVAGVYGAAGSAGIGAEVGAPSLAARSRRRRQGLAVGVGAGEAAEVGSLAETDTGDEEGHVGRFGRQCYEGLVSSVEKISDGMDFAGAIGKIGKIGKIDSGAIGPLVVLKCCIEILEISKTSIIPRIKAHGIDELIKHRLSAYRRIFEYATHN